MQLFSIISTFSTGDYTLPYGVVLASMLRICKIPVCVVKSGIRVDTNNPTTFHVFCIAWKVPRDRVTTVYPLKRHKRRIYINLTYIPFWWSHHNTTTNVTQWRMGTHKKRRRSRTFQGYFLTNKYSLEDAVLGTLLTVPHHDCNVSRANRLDVTLCSEILAICQSLSC